MAQFFFTAEITGAEIGKMKKKMMRNDDEE
jgi:hypothetical protein